MTTSAPEGSSDLRVSAAGGGADVLRIVDANMAITIPLQKNLLTSRSGRFRRFLSGRSLPGQGQGRE